MVGYFFRGRWIVHNCIFDVNEPLFNQIKVFLLQNTKFFVIAVCRTIWGFKIRTECLCKQSFNSTRLTHTRSVDIHEWKTTKHRLWNNTKLRQSDWKVNTKLTEFQHRSTNAGPIRVSPYILKYPLMRVAPISPHTLLNFHKPVLIRNAHVFELLASELKHHPWWLSAATIIKIMQFVGGPDATICATKQLASAMK